VQVNSSQQSIEEDEDDSGEGSIESAENEATNNNALEHVNVPSKIHINNNP